MGVVKLHILAADKCRCSTGECVVDKQPSEL